MGYWTTYAGVTGENPQKLGASHPSWGLYDVFEVDGEWLFVGVTTERHWPALCRVLDREKWLADERFDTAAKRRQRKTALTSLVDEAVTGWDRADLLDALEAERIPSAPVNQPADLLDDEGLEAAGLLTKFTSPDDTGADELQTVLTPVTGQRFGPSQRRDPPELGADTDAILAELGMDEASIEELYDTGTIGD